MLLIVYLCGSPIVAPSFAFKTCLSYVLQLHCISSLSVPFTIHSSTPTLCSSYLVFLFCVPFFLAVSSIVFFFTIFMCFLSFPTPCLQWNVFLFHSLFSFIFIIPQHSFSCLKVKVQFKCLMLYIFTVFPKQPLWLLCRAWLL